MTSPPATGAGAGAEVGGEAGPVRATRSTESTGAVDAVAVGVAGEAGGTGKRSAEKKTNEEDDDGGGGRSYYRVDRQAHTPAPPQTRSEDFTRLALERIGTTTSDGMGGREAADMTTKHGFQHSPLISGGAEGGDSSSSTQLLANSNTTTILLGRCINENITTAGERETTAGTCVTTAREKGIVFGTHVTPARNNCSGGGGSFRDRQNGGQTLQKQRGESDRAPSTAAHTAAVSAAVVDSTAIAFGGGGEGDTWSSLPERGATEIGNAGWSRMTIAMPGDHDGALHGERKQQHQHCIR